MYARKLFTGIATAALTVSVITMTAGSASAAPDPDDSPGVPVAADLIGVGSDTSQNALFRLANGYNPTNPTNKLFTYAATGGGTIALPDGSTPPRPNGSSAGKALLYGAGNNTNIDFARSSSAQSAAETAASLQSFPFALDTLGVVTSPSSNAPATLSIAQIVSIYKGETTNWSTVGGQPGPITYYIPQAGSGTRTFFQAQLDAANGGVAVNTAGATPFQENDDTLIKNNASAIAPFSTGRAGLLGTLRVENGFAANRALYNVVRGAEIGNFSSVFGSNGYVCSSAAKPLIEAAGFRQLFTPSRGGACGSPTTSATSNFTVDTVPTSTAVTVTSASASSARVVARINASTAPSGTVTFFEGATAVASNVPLVSGQATATPAAAPGPHTYRAVFTPAANTAFTGSEGVGTGTVAKATSSLKESFSSKATVTKKGKKTVVKPVKGKVTVTLVGSTAKATGKVVVKRGSKTVGTAALANGVASFKLKGLKPGKNKLKATWAGDANGNGSTLRFTIKAAKPRAKK
ncbi:MAG: substrate-binding domain-containing protein [Nocardioides sp.]|nr:substrate-binding domain-containing protein [Nocardioides sp.]